MKDEIEVAEHRLRDAMLRSDVRLLDELIAPDVLFTSHTGHLVSKEDDLAAHRSGRLRLTELEPTERHLRLLGDVAVVSLRTRVKGEYDGKAAGGDFRFTRVWARSPKDSWWIVAAHAILIP